MTGDPSVRAAGLWVNWRLDSSSCQMDVRYTQLQKDKRLTARVAKTTIAGYRERFSSQGNAWRRVRVNVHTAEWPFPTR